MEKKEYIINISKEEYLKQVKEETIKSPIIKNITFAFIIGGLICCIRSIYS